MAKQLSASHVPTPTLSSTSSPKPNSITSISFFNANIFAITSWNSTIIFYNNTTQLFELKLNNCVVPLTSTFITYNNQNTTLNLLITGNSDGTLSLIDLESRQIKYHKIHDKAISKLIKLDNNQIITGSWDQTLKLINLNDLQNIQTTESFECKVKVYDFDINQSKNLICLIGSSNKISLINIKLQGNQTGSMSTGLYMGSMGFNSNKLSLKLELTSKSVFQLRKCAFSGDKNFMVGSIDGKVEFFQISTPSSLSSRIETTNSSFVKLHKEINNLFAINSLKTLNNFHNIFISGGSDNQVIVANSENKIKLGIYKGRGPITAMEVEQSSGLLVFAEGEDFSRGMERKEIETNLYVIHLASSGCIN